MGLETAARHTNRLIDETSPYLLQHAHNPVDWYPWGEEALQRARSEDKPILLSVGYSACHWCHVMERESFEDEETAAQLNRDFVSIKVDREERPDVDAIYMEAVQALTRHGGWPMTVFLLPDGTPFYGGTYFPKESRYGLASFRQVLGVPSRRPTVTSGRASCKGPSSCSQVIRQSPRLERRDALTAGVAGAGGDGGRGRLRRALRGLRRGAQVPPADEPGGHAAPVASFGPGGRPCVWCG